MCEYSTRRSRVYYRRYKTRASSLIVLIEALKDCSPNPTILRTFHPKIKNNCPYKVYCMITLKLKETSKY